MVVTLAQLAKDSLTALKVQVISTELFDSFVLLKIENAGLYFCFVVFQIAQLIILA